MSISFRKSVPLDTLEAVPLTEGSCDVEGCSDPGELGSGNGLSRVLKAALDNGNGVTLISLWKACDGAPACGSDEGLVSGSEALIA